tara:strand:- start:1570 stop:2199 length:630 start_codon:yes stop_codon:yes gene_type:complete
MKINISRNMKLLLKNKAVLYIVLFIAVTNAMGYLMVSNFEAITLFFLVGLLTSYFSKNMIVVMLVAIIATNLLVGGKQISRTPLLEGLKNKKGEDHEDGEEDHDDEDDKEDKEPLSSLKPTTVNDEDAELDFPGSLEAAYDNLDKLLSSDAINKMSADTQKLAEKQQKLMGNIEKLEPMMNDAKKMMESLNNGKIESMMEKFLPSAKKN